MDLDLLIDDELDGRVRLAAVKAENLALDEGKALWEVFGPLCRDLASRYGNLPPGQVPGTAPARRLYRAVGVDPTKVRPSSEALLRRVIKGKDLYRVNSLVDTINYCSLCFLLPIGLYDLDRLSGTGILLRRGRPGESFEGIRKDTVNLEGRYALFDSAGPFGSPTSDSLRASITGSTTRCLAVIFAPCTLDVSGLENHARFMERQIAAYGGGGPETKLLGTFSARKLGY